MSSINPNNINGQYPVAGQDNDSQGFRDNFTNIRNNFNFAKTEIEDLQNKVIVTSALDGIPLSNDLDNTVLKGAQLLRSTETIKELGASGADITVNWDEGHFQSFELTGNATVAFDNWPDSGYYTKLRLAIKVSNVNTYNQITFTDTVVFAGLDNVLGGNANAKTIKFAQGQSPTEAYYVYEFSRYDDNYYFIQEVSLDIKKPSAPPYQFEANVANASVIHISNAVTNVVLEPNAAIATANISMPATGGLLDGQTVHFAFGNTITAVTHYGNGATILGGITTANVNAGASFVFRKTNLTWYRLG